MLKVGDFVRFYLGDAPMVGTILFAVGTSGAAIKLASGTEIIVNTELVTLTKAVKK